MESQHFKSEQYLEFTLRLIVSHDASDRDWEVALLRAVLEDMKCKEAEAHFALGEARGKAEVALERGLPDKNWMSGHSFRETVAWKLKGWEKAKEQLEQWRRIARNWGVEGR